VLALTFFSYANTPFLFIIMIKNEYSISKKLNAIPKDIVSLEDYERYASSYIPEPVLTYIRSGSADEISLKNNLSAFDSIKIYNRVLREFSNASTETTVLGTTCRHPIFLAPIAHQALVHEDAELATAQAADALETTMIASGLSSSPMEKIADHTQSPLWYQLYFQRDKNATQELIQRAEQSGFKAIVATVDVPINGLRNHIQRSGFALPNYAQSHQAPTTQSKIELQPQDSIIFQGAMSEAPTWDDIDWLYKQTRLPILLKGISHPLDAKQAMVSGASGIIISNHGGRSLDTLPATIEMLPQIRDILGKEACILLDGGIRRGTDILKSIALGANGVLIGRPQIYALAVAGALGVAHMLKLLRDELEVSMALTGCRSIAEIDENILFN